MIRIPLPFAALCLALLPGCGATAADPAPLPVTVVCWNIHHGRGTDGAIDLDRIARVLAEAAPDIVLLQEVDVGVARSNRVDIPAELAARLGMQARFGHNLDYQGGQYGNALLTRFPIEASHNHRYDMLRDGEQRGVLCTTVRTPAGALEVLVTHLDYRPDDRERLAHVEALRELATGLEQPVVLAGDFNAEPDSRVHAAAVAWARDVWDNGNGAGHTYPAGEPRKRIDWILLPPHPRLVAGAARVLPEAVASDHRPLCAELLLRPGR